MAVPEAIERKVLAGERLSRDEGVTLLKDASLLELGMLADAVRQRLHPEGIVTYIIDRNINYTNVCTAQCAFCAFYRDLPSKEGYLIWIHGLSPAEVKHIERVSSLTTEQTLRRLVAAGLDSIPGGGAEILSDRVRGIIGMAKGSTSEWLEVMETVHKLG